MRIGELAERTGTHPRSLRYYEQQDLIRPSRAPNGYRTYDEDTAARVVLIRELLDSGIPTRVIREMIPCLDHPDQPPVEPTHPALLAMLVEERDRMTARVDVLTRNRDALTRFIARAQQDA